MAVPQKVIELVERFERNKKEYMSSSYNETQVRREFVDPFFEALGWDVDNKSGKAEAYKDVIHEDALKIGGTMKAPDYSFRIGGTRKFFLETKKPYVDVEADKNPAYQIRRYSWNADLPLGVLTDFEEFAVYDCRIKPKPNDSASVARVMLVKYTEYATRWDEIAEKFSKTAIEQGSFDKFAEGVKGKRGTSEVGDEFLKEIESWREELAKNIALRNIRLSWNEMNFAVQKTIDRILFLRICEDRGIEPYGQLQDLASKENVYKRLKELFEAADEKYNSGLFHFKEERGRKSSPDGLTMAIKIDDKPLQDIIKRLYYPECPYEFSVLSVDILGNVYEQFLGKVIRLTPAHRAVVEEKPEVKKAGGVYYTPKYIVDYIVENTVGKLIEGKMPKQISELKVLDPACGSGSFLIGAYQRLLDYHRDWYVAHTPAKFKEEIYQGKGGQWYLTTKEKKRILLNNVYGVDIDSQAVEVTKLNLLLKVLENENQDTPLFQKKLVRERALPDLDNNIKCGNSLIGPDFYAGQTKLLDAEEQQRINVFDWEREFPFKFDVVIGNPPYLRIQGLRENYESQIGYFEGHYQSAIKRYDLYLLFIERTYALLNRSGRLGFICPHKFLNSDFGSGIRDFLIQNQAIESFFSFGNNLVFRQASTYTGILILSNRKKDSFKFLQMPDVLASDIPNRLMTAKADDFSTYNFGMLSSRPWVLTSSAKQSLLERMRKQPAKVETVFESVFVGVQSGIDDLYFLKPLSEKGGVIEARIPRTGQQIKIEKSVLVPMLKGEDISRYTPPKAMLYCVYPYKLVGDKTVILEESELSTNFPLAYTYLSSFKSELHGLRVKMKTNPRYWYSCHRSRSMAAFARERIICQEISLGCNMTIDRQGLYHNTTVYSLLPKVSTSEDILCWLGILNSKLTWWFLKTTGNVLRGGYFRFKTEYLNPFPLPRFDFSKSSDKSQHDKLVLLVKQILTHHKQFEEVRTPEEKTLLQRQIDAVDKQIDKLVYELYGLTEEEIKIVETSN